jgi:hypothetical protein
MLPLYVIIVHAVRRLSAFPVQGTSDVQNICRVDIDSRHAEHVLATVDKISEHFDLPL